MLRFHFHLKRVGRPVRSLLLVYGNGHWNRWRGNSELAALYRAAHCTHCLFIYVLRYSMYLQYFLCLQAATFTFNDQIIVTAIRNCYTRFLNHKVKYAVWDYSLTLGSVQAIRSVPVQCVVHITPKNTN